MTRPTAKPSHASPHHQRRHPGLPPAGLQLCAFCVAPDLESGLQLIRPEHPTLHGGGTPRLNQSQPKAPCPGIEITVCTIMPYLVYPVWLWWLKKSAPVVRVASRMRNRWDVRESSAAFNELRFTRSTFRDQFLCVLSRG